MSLIDLITENVVKVPLTSDNKPAVLRELLQILVDAGLVKDFNTVLAAIHDRENRQSTGLERGIAVPHAKTPSIKKLMVAVGISPLGIDFNSMDGKPSKLFFLLLAPPNQPGPHVEALAEIAKISQSNAFCNALINASSALDVVELLQED
jgi:fructose-specific phosphotransferase system IIA component